MQEYIKMEYLYRDGANYKSYGAILLLGEFKSEFEKDILDCLEDGVHFVAEQVNLPVLHSELWKYSNGPTTNDHAYHEFLSLKKYEKHNDEMLPILGDFNQVYKLFVKSKNNWDCTKSVHG